MMLLSPAKINLFLYIIGKRPDGYHKLLSLMCCIDIYDVINLKFKKNTISIKSDNPYIPLDQTNIAYKAASYFLNHLNIKEGVEISIKKNIPVSAGLGGGSSNAAIVLEGLNNYYDNPLTKEDLKKIGRNIGADVPFFIHKKPAIATGIGDRLKDVDKKKIELFYILLIFPGFGISTAEIYKNFNLGLTKYKKKIKNSFFSNLKFDISNHLYNDLENVVLLKYPEIFEIKELLLDCGAKGALMSGSGSTIFGLFSDFKDAKAAYHICFKKNNNWQIFLAKPLI